MKAIRIREPGDPGVLELADVPDPAPAAGEVVVRVRAAGVNRADLLQRMGRYPAPPGAPADIPGLEVAGTVETLGPGAAGAGFGVGDRVMAIVGGGGYAECVAVPATHLLPIPAGLSFVDGAAIPEAFLTAFDALFARGRLEAGGRVLVHSAGGGVGTAAIQLARAAGAARVIGTASAPKLEAIRERGLPLDVGVDYRAGDFAPRVLEATDGAGADVILDTVGAPYWESNLAALAELGTLVLVGVLGGARVEADLRALMRKRATVVGTMLRSRSADEKARLAASFRDRFLARFDADPPELRPVLDRALPLEEAAEAHRLLESDRTFGKLVLEVGA